MTEFEKLRELERQGHGLEDSIVVRNTQTGEEGVAATTKNGVYVWIGAGDGSDDAEMSAEEFNRRFCIVGVRAD
ncbi:MAG: hypothetical protein LUG65_03905 [Clostridiales bacterium]|nr:hypothetical protein [Clostridiales bacterium]